MKLTESNLRQLIREELQTELFGFSEWEKAIKKVQKEMYSSAFDANISNAIHKHLKPLIRSSTDAEDAIRDLKGIDMPEFRWMIKTIREMK